MANEKRLIDANELKQRFDEREIDDIELYGAHIVECFPSDDAKAIVDEMPTVDAVEVVHGRWEQGDFYDYGDVCSVCDWDSEINNCKWSYCPNCGANMMDGDGND